jgi:hypothetical protein
VVTVPRGASAEVHPGGSALGRGATRPTGTRGVRRRRGCARSRGERWGRGAREGPSWKNERNSAARGARRDDRAGRTGSRRINFVISHYFVDADKDFKVDYFCLKLSGACL